MKKRDFYIAGLLICVVGYAACHRKNASDNVFNITIGAPKQQVNTNVITVNPDSLDIEGNKIIKAGF